MTYQNGSTPHRHNGNSRYQIAALDYGFTVKDTGRYAVHVDRFVSPDDLRQGRMVALEGGGFEPMPLALRKALLAKQLDQLVSTTAPAAETPVTVIIDGVSSPGVAAVTVRNGKATALREYTWRYRDDPASLVRQLNALDPEHTPALRAALPAAADEARNQEPDDDLVVILPTDKPTRSPHHRLPDGLPYSADPDAPTLVIGQKKDGKTQLLAYLAAELALEGHKVAVMAAEGITWWHELVYRYPENLRPT